MKLELINNLNDLIHGIENAILIFYKEILKMKFELELKDVKPKSSKQKYILATLLKQAQHDYSRNNLINFLKNIETYNKYVDSLNGSSRSRVSGVKYIIPKTDHYALDPLTQNKSRFLRMMQELYKVSNNHRPNEGDKGKWIGVEIECFVPGHQEYDEDADEYQDVDETDTYDIIKRQVVKDKIKYVSMKGDSSIDPDDDHIGIEFTVLTKIDDLSNLEKLCKLLDKIGAKVNSTCGLHIHLDQREVFKKNTALRDNPNGKELSARLMRLNQALPLLTATVPKSRRNNRYCSTSRSRMRNSDRYMAINTQALSKFGTLEVRLHSATINFTKIANWIKLCHGISRCTKIKNGANHVITSIEQLKTKYMTDMPLDMVTYFTQRIEKFKNTESSGEDAEYSQDRLVVNSVDQATRSYAISSGDQIDRPIDYNRLAEAARQLGMPQFRLTPDVHAPIVDELEDFDFDELDRIHAITAGDDDTPF